MTLIDVLPKDVEGNIKLSPAANIDGIYVEGTVSVVWFKAKFSTLSNAIVPLSNNDLSALKAIDPFWSQNADKWRTQGII